MDKLDADASILFSTKEYLVKRMGMESYPSQEYLADIMDAGNVCAACARQMGKTLVECAFMLRICESIPCSKIVYFTHDMKLGEKLVKERLPSYVKRFMSEDDYRCTKETFALSNGSSIELRSGREDQSRGISLKQLLEGGVGHIMLDEAAYHSNLLLGTIAPLSLNANVTKHMISTIDYANTDGFFYTILTDEKNKSYRKLHVKSGYRVAGGRFYFKGEPEPSMPSFISERHTRECCEQIYEEMVASCEGNEKMAQRFYEQEILCSLEKGQGYANKPIKSSARPHTLTGIQRVKREQGLVPQETYDKLRKEARERMYAFG